MPLKAYRCSICGRCCPKEYLKHGKMAKRMGWLRRHRAKYHSAAFSKSIRKGVKTRRK